MGTSIVNTVRTGKVFVRDFDAGIVETLGAEIRVRTVNEKQKKSFYIDMTGVGVDIPVIMASPEVEFEMMYLPSIVVRREEPSFASNRWPSIGSAYRMPVGPNVTVGQATGKSRMEIQVFAYPYDIVYTLEGYTRLKNQAVRMLDFILFKYRPYGKVFVNDSLGEKRSYECFQEGVSSLDEVTDVSERHAGFAVTLRVIGELDHVDSFETPTVTQPAQINTVVK